MSSQLRSRYDIIINGGGIVGFTLLNLILKSPQLNRCKVLLIEQAPRPASFHQRPKTQGGPNQTDGTSDHGRAFSNRVSSITLSSKSAFKELGVWDIIRPFAKDVRQIKVWNYDYSHKINFKQNLSSCNKDLEERDIMFSTVENDRLSAALLENIHKQPKSADKILWNSSLQNLDESLDSGLIDVSAKSNQDQQEVNISAPLVLGCDGFNSKVRDLTKINYREYKLKKTAVVGTVRMSKLISSSDNDIAYQRFSAEKDTVAAILPLDKDYSSFVISAPEQYAKYLVDCNDDTFIKEFNTLLSMKEQSTNVVLRGLHEAANLAYVSIDELLKLFKNPLRRDGLAVNLDERFDDPPILDSVVSNSRASFPLIFGTTSPRMVTSLPGTTRPQIALLGDASHRVHPLAGQGLNLGIQDAIELVRQLELVARTGEQVFGEPSLLCKVLRRYELRRQAYVIPMSAGILAMQDLFKLAPSRLISSIDRCEPVKTTSVRMANGM